MKRLIAVALLALVASPCFGAGTINLSLSQQFDTQGKPLSGCKLYFFQAGTTTPQSAYQDTSLSIPYPNPMECDASGRIPQFFVADGNIKIRLADKNGNTILAADNLLVVGASSGGGGGGSVDATTVLATGDIKVRYINENISGWVRLTGRTIGSASSGATERANADTQALFEHLWNKDSNLTVSGGRGASSTADFTANKTITLPDARGRVIAGLDDMGASSAARLNTLSSTTLGASGGGQTVALATTNLPAISYTPAGTIALGYSDPGHAHIASDTGHVHSITDPGHIHGVTDSGHSHGITDPGHNHSYNQYNSQGAASGGGFSAQNITAGSAQTTAGASTGISINSAATGVSVNSHTTGISVVSNTTGISVLGAYTAITFSPTFTGTLANLGGSATPMNVLQPTILMTIYIKL